MGVIYRSTNNSGERVNFETALLNGMASNYGLYMMDKSDIPKLSKDEILLMKDMNYAQIAFIVLNSFLKGEIPDEELKILLNDAYDEKIIPVKIEKVTDKINIMWLTQGPTYSFKDYAARFYARMLNRALGQRQLKRSVIVATSGDTGGAVADALYGLNNVDNIVFYPKGSISEGQRRQMTTLQGNVYAFEVNGDFDVCQALAKSILGDKGFAQEVFGDKDRFTSANSISIGRLLPQVVYPFFAYSRIANGEEIVASIPSGNFGDMIGTVIAKQMGLPIAKIICGVNDNVEFPEFLKTGKYLVKPTINSPSSAMNVSHPSNLARLIDFYGGYMFDKRENGKVVEEGVIDKMPDMEAMRKDIFSVSISSAQHFVTIKSVFDQYGIILDPHGAVGWEALELFGDGDQLSIIYETADPGKFPKEIKKAIGIEPEIPKGIKMQAEMEERIFSINSDSLQTDKGFKLTDAQIKEAKEKISQLFS